MLEALVYRQALLPQGAVAVRVAWALPVQEQPQAQAAQQSRRASPTRQSITVVVVVVPHQVIVVEDQQVLAVVLVQVREQPLVQRVLVLQSLIVDQAAVVAHTPITVATVQAG